MTSVERPVSLCVDCNVTAAIPGTARCLRCSKVREAAHNAERKIYRTTEWRWKRKQVLHRDYYQCVLCTTHHQLQVHHINHQAADMRATNLVTLCNTCHMALESEWRNASTHRPVHVQLEQHLATSPHHRGGNK